MKVAWLLELEDARLVSVALNAAAQRARERLGQGEQEQAQTQTRLEALRADLADEIAAARAAGGRPSDADPLRELRARLRDQPEFGAARVADLLDLIAVLIDG